MSKNSARGYRGIRSLFRLGRQIEKPDPNEKLLVSPVAFAPELGNAADKAGPTKIPDDLKSDQRAYIALYPAVK